MNASSARSARASSPRPERKPTGWDNAVRRDFIRAPMNPRLREFLLVAEDLGVDLPWGVHAWGVASNADIKAILGCSDEALRKLWLEAEGQVPHAEGEEGEPPWLKRVFDPDKPSVRLGFVWLRRPTARPVACTPAEIDRAEAELRAAVRRQQSRARTVPFPTDDPGPAAGERGGDPPTSVGGTPQRAWGGSEPGPIEERARPETQEESKAKTTTTEAHPGSGEPPDIHAPHESSSSYAPLGEGEGRERTIPIAEAIRRAEASEPSAASVYLDMLLTACIALLMRISARFKDGVWTAEQARDQVIRWMAWLRNRRLPEWWVWLALRIAEDRPDPRKGRSPAEKPGYVFGVLDRWAHGDPGRPHESDRPPVTELHAGPAAGPDPGPRASPRVPGSYVPGWFHGEIARHGWGLGVRPDGRLWRQPLREDFTPWPLIPPEVRDYGNRHLPEVLAEIRAREGVARE
jgi:hypothetical protein